MNRPTSWTLVIAGGLAAGVVGLLLWQLLTGFDQGTRLLEHLRVTAPARVLHPGQSTQLAVRKKRGPFLDEPMPHPERTTYFTVSEAELVVEPDGAVTCVGTGPRPDDVIWVLAENGPDHGHTSFELRAGGPGPTLDFIAEQPASDPVPDAMKRYAPCCAGDPVVMKEGEPVHYRLVRRQAPWDDLTARATYTLFFGSGIPNDPRPSLTTGGHDYLSSLTFHVDPQHGILTPPASIGRDNFEQMVLLARYRDCVGWKYLIIRHAEADGREGHLRLHPEEAEGDRP